MAGATTVASWLRALNPAWLDRGITALVVLAIIVLGSLTQTLIGRRISHPSNSTEPASPLIFADGVLKWRNTETRPIANKHFVNDVVPLDGIEYINCVFEHSTLVYEGTATT
jgi:hypothetical protein